MKHNRLNFRLIVLIAIHFCLLITSSQAATLNYKTAVEIDHYMEGDIVYLSMSDMADALGFTVDFDPFSIEAILSNQGDKLILNLFSSYVNLNDNLRNIIYPVRYYGADFYIPAKTFVPVLADFARITLIWDDPELTIRGSELEYNVIDLKFSPRTNGYLCEIMLAHPLEYEVLRSEGDWLQITLQGGKLNENYIIHRPHSRVIRRIRAFQFDGSAQISLNFRRAVTEINHNLAVNPPRIQISIIDTLFDYSSIDTIFTDDDFDPIDVIVIDAGHGGIEDGAIGQNGTKEKEIVLDIAKRLASLFESEDEINVILTRDDDTTLLLDERAEIANSSSGDIFISIHANWFESGSAKGTQTFFLAAALNDAARATAMLENKSILISQKEDTIENLSEIDLILFDLLQTEYLTESQMLAADIQKQLVKQIKTKDRGVDQAGFFVLNQVFMPSVLVETAFISNRHEETLLKKESFRQKVAEGIHQGIKNFIDKYTPER
jgi:N-acetylmuramoyl-L-alanine amidase